ncbi:MAG: T9SS type A sorting domain-containing protein [Balneolales bacterium]|nr:T9SS type A sorting domain-containing protein [Balneolales bacterium]
MCYKKTLFLALFLFLLPLQTWAQSAEVTFRVNMSYQANQENFNPDSQFVDVAGNFNGWDGAQSVLSDEDADLIYEVTIDGFEPGENLQFKFRIDGLWDGNEEFPGGGPNRSYTVQSGTNIISVWYNDELPPDGPPVSDFSPQGISIFKNGVVSFQDRSGGEILEWEWQFEGGSPAVSTDRNPVVFYEETGTFGVRLITRNEELADTLYVPAAVVVQERETTETHWWNDTVFYEIFVRSFFDSSGDGTGDFEGMLEKLDYLNDGDPDSGEDLGITGIWLMPIHESPNYHGYDVLDYTSVNSDFGTMEQFQTFLNAAQERGIRVIIDYVLNHTSREHPWFINSRNNVPGYRDYYRWKPQDPGYSGPWGQQVWHNWGGSWYYGLFWGGMPDVNFHNETVKEKLFEAADFWLNDIGVDGFRLDAVTYIFEDGEILEHTPETFAFWEEFNARVKEQNPEAVTVGEAWTNTEQIIPYVTNNRLDFAFEFDLSYAMLNAVRSANAAPLYNQVQKVYNSYNYLQFATFLTNHDQNRVMNELNNNWEQAKAAASIYLTLPGVPFIYYGEEIGMTGAKPDPQIRTPMQWTDGPAAGFTTGTPWINLNPDYQIRNVAVQQEDPNSLLNHYKRLIQLRTRHQALRTGAYLPAQVATNEVFSFLRSTDTEHILTVINLGSGSQQNLPVLPAGVATEPGYYDLQELYSGDDIQVEIMSDGRIIIPEISARSVMLLSLDNVVSVSLPPDNSQGELPARLQLNQNYPNPFNPTTTITYRLPQSAHVQLDVYNVQGQRVATLVNNRQEQGFQTAVFDASRLASGMYIYQLTAGGEVQARTMVLVK